jgi:3-oxoacyl-[acyl-carrier protein] reductase
VLTDEQKATIGEIIPAKRFGDPIDVAAGCLYLASNEGGYITGQTLHINGGMAMV